ncbi:MAG: ABC transporter ATP-binding protein [Candidatus Pelethousia sp.]|nr:ABC transporter ATP-binding protein [Candidatus Pelethousia sp.]
MALLEIRDLVVSYGHVSALNGISLDVEPGQIVSVIGANGAGKSSLLNTISGMVKPKAGEIRFEGASLLLPPDKVVKKGVAQVPEGRKIFDGLTVEENLIMGAVNGAKQAKGNFELAYRLFPILCERKKQQGGTLSGGEQQMLAIARAMMSSPKLIMFDEPSMGLAPVIIKQVFKFIKEINTSGVTVLLIEQNAKQALQSSDYTYVLENGCVIMQGESARMLTDERVIKAYLGE